MNSKKIVFLFGSGISIPAGMPTTAQVTERVLSGNNIYRHSAEVYEYSNSINEYQRFSVNEFIRRVLFVLNRLKDEVEQYYKSKPFKLTWNYEDLYFLSKQIRDSELGEYENPALQPFINQLLIDFEDLMTGKGTDTREQWRLHELADESCNYIQDILFILLKAKIEKTDYLHFLYECYKDKSISNIEIFTLNHDKVLESFFDNRDIKYTDGFGSNYPKIRSWEPNLLKHEKPKIKIIKLHGGIDWRRIRLEGMDWHGEFIGIPEILNHDHEMDDNGNIYCRIFPRPYILIGTYNKMLDYVGGIFDDLFYYFYQSIQEAETLIISGYSFGDRGINTKIIDWMYSSYNHRIVVIHPNPENLKNNSLGSIANKWEYWKKQEKLLLIPKSIENLSWHDIQDIL